MRPSPLSYVKFFRTEYLSLVCSIWLPEFFAKIQFRTSKFFKLWKFVKIDQLWRHVTWELLVVRGESTDTFCRQIHYKHFATNAVVLNAILMVIIHKNLFYVIDVFWRCPLSYVDQKLMVSRVKWFRRVEEVWKR